LFFRSEAGIDRWCSQNNVQRGETLSLSQLWALAQAWYHNRMDPQFRGRTVEEAQGVFRQLGLRSPFWYLDADGA
jgi:hypothetical protein